MKKIILSAALLATTVAFTAEAKPKASTKSQATVLKSDKDSTSYALGMEFGKNIKSTLSNLPGNPFDKALLLEALGKVLNDDTTSLSIKADSANKVIQTNLQKAAEAENQKRAEEEKAFFAENKKRPEIKETKSGLQYEILKMGNGARPNSASSKVKVHYVGTLRNGEEFDSSIKRGEPAEFQLSGVIKGWTEGLQLMNVGSKYKFYIPYNLGYGERGQGPIKPYSTLIFDVELLDVENPDPQTIKGSKYQFQQYQRSDR